MLQQAFEVFLRHHHQGNKRVNAAQLQAVLEEAGLEMSKEQVEEILRSANVSHSGELDFEEFYSLFVGLKIFRHLDKTKSATIQEYDLIKTLDKYGLPTDRSLVSRMIQMVGEDENGYVSFPAFFRIYLDVHHQHHHNIDLLEHAVRYWYSGVSKDTILAQNQTLTPLQDFVAGTFAGVAITLVGHPFDTIKVRLQTQHQAYASAIQATLKTIRDEGFRGLYKGMGSPMVTIPLINAIVFSAYGQAKSWMQGRDASDEDLSIPQLALAGAWAGFVNSAVVTPVELIKIRLQNQYENTAAQFNLNLKERLRSGLRSSLFERKIFYNGPIDCIVKITKEKGVSGLWKGMSSTIYREIPGYMGQFVVYEYVKRYLILRQGPDSTVDNLHPLHLMLAGGLSGIGAWLASYPMDYVKTHIQSAFDAEKYRKNKLLLDGGFIDCWRQIVKENGFTSLWRGFGPCVARAFPANAAGFLGYELVARLFRDQNAATSTK